MFNKLKNGNDFSKVRHELMNMGINYDDKIENSIKVDLVEGVKSERDKVSNTGTKI